ncbi:MAG: TRAP-type uncharacterized transport system fused permease subunit [Limimaricola cinnabarinus]|jgi:TRAP-type uncharacterized transport system fused permease subunit
MFVFYFATISVITPPVCVAVFVGAGIAQTNWLPAAREAVRLGAMTYVVSFLILIYPGMIGQGGTLAVANALFTGLVLVVAIPFLLGRLPLTGRRAGDVAIYLFVIALTVVPHPMTPLVAALILAAGWMLGRRSAAALESNDGTCAAPQE